MGTFLKWGKLFLVFVLGSLIIASFAIPLYIYYKKFGIYGLSSDSSVWGNFGEYINGITTPLLTIINTFILFFLMRAANKLQKQSAIIDIKQIVLKPYIDRISSLIFDIELNYSAKDPELTKKLTVLGNQFSSFIIEIEPAFNKDKSNFDLFKKSEESIQKIIKELKSKPSDIYKLGELIKSKYILFAKINDYFRL